MMCFKNGYLSIVMTLIIICLTVVTALVERSSDDFETCKRFMKNQYKYFTGNKGEVETFTADEYAKGLIRNYDQEKNVQIHGLIIPYFHKVILNMIPGDNMKLPEEFCQKENEAESSSSQKSLGRKKKKKQQKKKHKLFTVITTTPSEEEDALLLANEPQTYSYTYLDTECYEALVQFGDYKNTALVLALHKRKLKQFDDKKQSDITRYLEHIADTVTFKNHVEEPYIFCKYYPNQDVDDE